ncbi:hypothetical protein [Adhaeribacter radiodurans]|uniref:Lipocalin family protein n=1 Tax=Adhaeribacter radiodurans TaxID=2745197 RepID=A0A7L7LAB0_9BACT|nr:hypothetical protein [Adhaeribacter radiodurans]QMU29683.1 hypothetical protein HUW48_17335 [Adhaeribacter radiodurans]
MKNLLLLPLFSCLLGLGYWTKQQTGTQLNDILKGKWGNERIQLQYIVDSNLMHEEEIISEKGKTYSFDGSTIQITYPDGTVAQGTYSVFMEEEKKKVALQLHGTTTTYTLIAVTPTSMTWQKDMEDTNYQEGLTRKSAERAIYTEVFKKIIAGK